MKERGSSEISLCAGALKEVTALSGAILPLNCQVENISFAAHTDVLGSWSFVQEMIPKYVGRYSTICTVPHVSCL